MDRQVARVAPNSEVAGTRRSRVDLRVGTRGISLNANTSKFELYRSNRPDLAHLTIDWGTKSGDLDIHLTYEHERPMGGGGTKRWQPLLRISRATRDAFDRLLPAWMEGVVALHDRRYRRYRPGWMWRHGYVVQLLPTSDLDSWGAVVAPRVRGKHRIDPEGIFDTSRMPVAFRENLHDPRALHHEDLSAFAKTIQAFSLDGNLGRALILGRHLSRPGWWGMTNADSLALANRVLISVFDTVIACTRPEYVETLEKVVVGLGLEEDAFTRDIAAELRVLLRDGRHPLRGRARARWPYA
jgi:hypothetical protein